MKRGATNRGARIPITPAEAARWFLRDMASCAGYTIPPEPGHDPLLAGYVNYRPLLTAPDPWYFAGVLALEACKVVDYYPPEFSNEVTRIIIDEADKTVGREGGDVSTLAFLIMGRLGIGTVLLRGKAPDFLLGKIMTILMGSEKSAQERMPAPEAHKQLRAALKLGRPVWWRVFRKKYFLSFNPEAEMMEEGVLVPSAFAIPEPEPEFEAPLELSLDQQVFILEDSQGYAEAVDEIEEGMFLPQVPPAAETPAAAA